ncbi:hypothetical protein J7E93_30885 [Streptomyces sp. ISL-36]|uniref:DUF6401 family natural product biosynthesis protein n=1 Tax=Streptomyces sp. ISL-36 TaxID=2819182 RepID=UPI001BEC8594|nr:DUF6401 family natural product biosynthesis protein [Streptomyces sp. ISL-36]MBT2444425.1 hypothetical protein [Streptomyces sp. ISL-36]
MNDSPGCPLVGVAATYMPRLSEFPFEPGLVAAVDQHAAEVRDALIPAQRGPARQAASRTEGQEGNRTEAWAESGSERPAESWAESVGERPADSWAERRTLRREDLSDYVLGFTDWLAEADWVEPVGYDFATLRLTAVCWLIREHDLLGA